jgi:hypothetical protein
MDEFRCVIRYPSLEGEGEPSAPDGVQFNTLIAVSKAAYWGRDVTELPTSFLDVSDAPTRNMILEHLNEWEIGIKFVWSQSGGVIRITTGAGGYWSVLGKGALQVPRGNPTMNLQHFHINSSLSERRRVIPHEGAHALGAEHEHLRPQIVADINPTKAYAYYWRTQGWGRAIVDQNVLRPLDEASVMSTPVDVNSIMAYPIAAEITYSGRFYPGGAVITDTDRSFMQGLYPGDHTPPPMPPQRPDPPVDPPVEPPVVPPGPGPVGEVMGPYDLKLGAESRSYRMAPGQSFVFRVKVPRGGDYAAATRSKLDLRMDLRDGKSETPVESDDDSGLGGNPLISAPLTRGTYFLHVKGAGPDTAGAFKVRCVAI